MYQLWKVAKRANYLINSRTAGGVVLTYLLFGICKSHFDNRFNGYVILFRNYKQYDFGVQHSGNYYEELR